MSRVYCSTVPHVLIILIPFLSEVNYQALFWEREIDNSHFNRALSYNQK